SAETLVDQVRNGQAGVDAVFEMVGAPSLVDTALRCLRPQGSCVVVGISPDRLGLRMRQETVVVRELSVIGSFGATAAEIAELAGMGAAVRLDLTGSGCDCLPPEVFAAAMGETRDEMGGSERVAISYR